MNKIVQETPCGQVYITEVQREVYEKICEAKEKGRTGIINIRIQKEIFELHIDLINLIQ